MAVSLWWTERTEHGEVLVFRAGELVYKRWPDGSSVTFGAVPRFAYGRQAPSVASPPSDAPLAHGVLAGFDRGRLGG